MLFTRFNREISNKNIIFSYSEISGALSSNSMNHNDFDHAIDSFLQQNNDEIKNVLSNYDGLEISLTSSSNNRVEVSEDVINSLNEKIGKIYLNIDWFSNFKK
jgi:hypothetical protein